MAYKYTGKVISCLIQYLLLRLTPTLILQFGHSKDRLLRRKSEERKLIFVLHLGLVIGCVWLAIFQLLNHLNRPSESFSSPCTRYDNKIGLYPKIRQDFDLTSI